jgi:hypothetical protein
MPVDQSLKSTISFYFPELSCAQLLSIDSMANYQAQFVIDDLPNDWQQEFCKQIGFGEKSLPWNKLRALQFDIPDDMQTVVCCDPVMMQMTHRGAYLWGQSQLEFSKEEVIRIIAQINQQLMGDGEYFYLLDNHQWLYTNKKAIELTQSSFEEYIGKDRFGFSYQGKDGVYWDKLATEIQMLIKQMMDYQGLTQVPAEMIVNVHFWGNTDHKVFLPFETLADKSLQVFSSDGLLKLFCQKSDIKLESLESFQAIISKNNNEHLNNIILLMLNNELADFSQLVKDSIENSKSRYDVVRLITQDKVLEVSKSKTLWQKIKSVFK